MNNTQGFWRRTPRATNALYVGTFSFNWTGTTQRWSTRAFMPKEHTHGATTSAALVHDLHNPHRPASSSARRLRVLTTRLLPVYRIPMGSTPTFMRTLRLSPDSCTYDSLITYDSISLAGSLHARTNTQHAARQLAAILNPQTHTRRTHYAPAGARHPRSSRPAYTHRRARHDRAPAPAARSPGEAIYRARCWSSSCRRREAQLAGRWARARTVLLQPRASDGGWRRG